MAKKCTIYYATVVNSDAFDWSKPVKHHMEPVKVEGRDPLGKQPEFCCEDLRDAMGNFTLSFSFFKSEMSLNFGNNPLARNGVHFCPFCGAKILFKEHLKLKVIETPITRHTYHYVGV